MWLRRGAPGGCAIGSDWFFLVSSVESSAARVRSCYGTAIHRSLSDGRLHAHCRHLNKLEIRSQSDLSGNSANVRRPSKFRPKLSVEIQLGSGCNGLVTGRRPGNPIERRLFELLTCRTRHFAVIPRCSQRGQRWHKAIISRTARGRKFEAISRHLIEWLRRLKKS